MKILGALLLALVLGGTTGALGADLAAPTGSHLTKLKCADCHEGTPPGKIADCEACHDPELNLHPIGLRQNKVPPHMALDENKAILCRTCHRIHGGDPDISYLNEPDGARLSRAAFCAQCHGPMNVRMNPHNARKGDNRCAFCHKSIPDGVASPLTTLRVPVARLCDFCHGATELNHPRNIDPTLTIPKELPRAPDGNWTCATCHDPHGTTATTHYVRPLFAKQLERGRQQNPHKNDYFACTACHTQSTPDKIRVAGFALRFRGDINILCVSCHVTDRGHHPTALTLPQEMKQRVEKSGHVLPLDAQGRINCYTCHDNHCDTGDQRMTQRYYSSKTYTTDLCWVCHEKTQFAARSPHVPDPAVCTYCHPTRPVRGMPVALMTVPKMVCLHCHEVKPHPVGVSHMRAPSEKIHPDKALPLSGAGEVTCVTCHNPHAESASMPYRLRAKPQEICNQCHWKG
jgi:predicted CXXCH cytochrome family protein